MPGFDPERFLPKFLAQQFRAPRSEDFPGVVIALEHAQRSHSVSSKADPRREQSEKLSADDEEHAPPLDGSSDYNPLTIEGLRHEVETDLAAFGSNTAYDRT